MSQMLLLSGENSHALSVHSLNFTLLCILANNVALLTAVPQMSVLTTTQQTPYNPQGGGETQMSKWAIVPSRISCTFMVAFCLLQEHRVLNMAVGNECTCEEDVEERTSVSFSRTLLRALGVLSKIVSKGIDCWLVTGLVSW